LRVVAAGGVLVPDPTGRLPGRGASVHRDLQCVILAERRRAFPRALRLDGPVDVAPVRKHLEDAQQESTQQDGSTAGQPAAPQQAAREH